MRRRLTLLVAATTSVVLLAFLIPVALLTGDVAESSALRRALAQSQSLVAVASAGDEQALSAAVLQVQADGLGATVHLEDGSQIGTPHRPDAEVERTAETGSASVRTTASGSRVILQPVFAEDGTQVVRVEVPPELLTKGVQRARLALVLLALVLFVGCLLVADRLARSLTRPLAAVGAAAERLAEGDLSTRVEPEGTHETREIARAMNRLSTRVGELLEAEREQVADLSHRLRTPITVLRLDVESLADGADRARLSADVEELTRQVDAVIREARRTEREGGGAGCDAAAVVHERVAAWRPLAEEQGRELTAAGHLEPDPTGAGAPSRPLQTRLAAADLAAAVDALIGNVMAHTPEGAPLRVCVQPTGDEHVLVAVEDGGPGLPTEDVLRRGSSRAGSTGLGLDIARRTAEASGGSMVVTTSEALGGARVELVLGPPA